MASIFPTVDLGDNVSEIVENDSRSVLKIENETGEGIMTLHKLFPGVVVIYNDFHMTYCISEFQAEGDDLLCVDHCREGRMEQRLSSNLYYYLSPGDMNVDIRRYHAGMCSFPQNHYHGVTVAIYLPEASEQLKKELVGFPVSPQALRQKFCPDEKPTVLHRSEGADRLFNGFYHLPRGNPLELLRLKVFELLLYLDGLPMEKEQPAAYFYKGQVDKVKAVQRLITENLTEHYTVEALSRRYDLAQSALKSCFKAIYGLPIYSYLQDYRVKRAAALLREDRSLPVNRIASMVGYDSPGKFAAVFKRVYGVTPREYRNGGEMT